MHCNCIGTSDKMPRQLQEPLMDSSESLEEKTNDTQESQLEFPFINRTAAAPGEGQGWHWDSADFWLTVLVVLICLLVLVNILLYLKCIQSVNRTLCRLQMDDLILFVFGLILPSGARRPKTDAGEPSAFNNSSLEFLDDVRPTAFCCFKDRAHKVSETMARNKLQPRKEDYIVDLRVKTENRLAGKEKIEEGKKEAIGLCTEKLNLRKEESKRGHFAAGTTCCKCVKIESRSGHKDGDDRYLENLNVVKNGDKVTKKAKLQPVPEELSASPESGAVRTEKTDADHEHASVANSTRDVYVCGSSPIDSADATSDPEIFI